MVSPLRITVLGALGRMGREVLQALEADDSFTVSALVIEPDWPQVGLRPSPALPPYTDDLVAACRNAQVVVDFSSPTSLEALSEAARESRCAVVSGTTGLTVAQHASLRSLAAAVPVFYSPNMSIGIQVMVNLIRQAVGLLGPDYDLEVLENHHRFKQDAPSGTALRLCEVIAEAQSDVREVPCHSVRGGDVVGDHTVFFQGLGDRLELTHRATSRQAFARGALRAARWLVDQEPGPVYSMDDLFTR